MSLLFADIFEAIRTLRVCKGTTEKCIMNYVEERVGGCLGVAHTLKTIRTLNKLVEDGVLCKKGKRYLFASKAAKCKKRKCQAECDEEDNCNECDFSDDCDNECEIECDNECDKVYDPCDDEDEDDDSLEDDDDYDDDDDDDECDENEYRADSRDEEEVKPYKTKSPRDLRGDVSKGINHNNNKPLIDGRTNKEDNYRPPIGDKRNDVINKCFSGKPTPKPSNKSNSSSSKPLGKSTCKSMGKSATRRSGNVKNIKTESEVRKSNRTRQDNESPRKGSMAKTKTGSSENLSRRYSPRRRDSRIRRHKMKRHENNRKSISPDRIKGNRSRSPVKKCTNNVYQTLNFDYPVDFGLNSFSSQIFQQPVEPEMTDLEKREENFGMDFDLHVQNSVTSNPSGPLLNNNESSDSDSVGKKFKEDLKMDTVFEGKTQDPMMRTLECQQHSEAKAKDSKKFKKDGEAMLVDGEKKAKEEGTTSLCSVCEKKKRSS